MQTDSAGPTVAVTPQLLEQALRDWLACFEYDLHKQTACDEETGEDAYPEEAARFFAVLQRVAGA
ncbi:hypothetical protein AB0952_08590 [Streptomyces caniferus]|uniref:hypothetical protein n=1 Tax=Streptomyces caniferus TaxID=285557 RepID=UPI0034547AC8